MLSISSLFLFGFCLIYTELIVGNIGVRRTSSTVNIKPSIHFDDLELKCLCDVDELRQQMTKKLRSKWTKCLGLARVYLPYNSAVPIGLLSGRSESGRRSQLDDNTWKRLRLFMSTSDESMNVFCRLANNWKACSYHLKTVHCLQSNQHAIQLAKNPKYSPLHHSRQTMHATTNSRTKSNSKRYLATIEREDHIENMAELYQIRCEHIRMSAHYMNGGAGSSSDVGNWLNRYNQHLFDDYQYQEEESDDEENEIIQKRKEL